MPIDNRILKITLSEDDREKLVRKLNEMSEAAEEHHSTWSELHDRYLRQYLTKPDQEEKMFPWPGASNVYLPLGRVIQDGIMSQLHDAMFSNDPMIRVVGNSDEMDVAGSELLSLFYNEYVFKQVINLKKFGNAWNFQTCLDGTSAAVVRWNKDLEIRRDILPRVVPKYSTETIEVAGVEVQVETLDDYERFFEEQTDLVPANRPSLELEDLNNLYISPDTLPSVDGEGGLQRPHCPWYYRQLELTKEELLWRKHHAGYENVDSALLASESTRDVSDQERTRRKAEGLSESTAGETITVREYYVPLILPGKYRGPDGIVSQEFEDEAGYSEDAIVTFFPETNQIARILPLQRIRADRRRPHVVNWYNQIPFSFYGQGIQAKMHMLNATDNAAMNMMIDGGHLANTPFYFYNPVLTGLMPDMHSLIPGQGVAVNDPRGVQMAKFQHDQSWFLNLMSEVQQFAERDGNVTDFTLGRSPEKSATKTARGTIALLQQGALAFGRLASLMIGAYEELFRAVHADYKRHAPDNILFRVTRQSGGMSFRKLQTMPREIISQEVDFQFVLNPNRQQLIQNYQILFQLMISIPYIQQNPRAVRALAKQLYDATGTKNFNEIWPEIPPQQMQPQLAQPASAMPGQAMTPQIPQPAQSMGGISGSEANMPAMEDMTVQ